MHCPRCGKSDLKVVDSRDNANGVRRRRQCLSCEYRFTTYERLEQFRCPQCESTESRVLSAELAENGVRRRRECLECNHRCTTVERSDMAAFLVRKRDNRREEFNRSKIFEGVRLACLNRPVAVEDIEELVDSVSSEVLNAGLSEISARRIGDMVMERLRDMDAVAYVRFASVYRRFEDVDSLAEVIGEIKEHTRRRELENIQPRLIPDK
jgi:transcriptional repressor NrdR